MIAVSLLCLLLRIFLAIDQRGLQWLEASVRDLQRVVGLHAAGCGEPGVACMCASEGWKSGGSGACFGSGSCRVIGRGRVRA